MDPETEKHLAALILEEASRFRLQAEKDGVHVYLSKPRARGRPNPQFLQATVRSVEQANRAAEINEMWRRRAMELELERKRKKGHRRIPGTRLSNETEEAARLTSSSNIFAERSSDSYTTKHQDSHHRRSSPRLHVSYATDQISKDDSERSCGIVDDLRDEGLKDDEVEQFLHSRVKRGRGAIGSRMDDPGPYPLPQPASPYLPDIRLKEDWEAHAMGPVSGPSVAIEKGQLLESKKHKKKRHKAEDMDKEERSGSDRKQDKKKTGKKHRSLHRKKSRKTT